MLLKAGISNSSLNHNTNLVAFFQDNLSKPVPKGQTILDFTEAEMMGWQWDQLDHMQVICTLIQTDNHANTSSVITRLKILLQILLLSGLLMSVLVLIAMVKIHSEY